VRVVVVATVLWVLSAERTQVKRTWVISASLTAVVGARALVGNLYISHSIFTRMLRHLPHALRRPNPT
jgi:hypothetical protein